MNTEFPDKYIMLGLKIAYYRRKAGYTQEYFAELIGKLKFTRVTDTDTEVAPSPRGTANKVNLFDIEI